MHRRVLAQGPLQMYKNDALVTLYPGLCLTGVLEGRGFGLEGGRVVQTWGGGGGQTWS